MNRSGSLDIPVTSAINNTYATVVPFSTFISTAGKHKVRIAFEVEPNDPGGLPFLRQQVRFNSFSLQPVAPPTASIKQLQSIRAPADSLLINVDYADNAAINVASIDGADVRITGPNGFSQTIALVSKTEATNNSAVTATYRFSPVGTGFDPADNGNYTITLLGQQVSDAGGLFAASQTLGTILVAVPQFLVVDNPLSDSSTLSINAGEGNDQILVSVSGFVITATINGVAIGTADARIIDTLFVSGGGGSDEISLVGVALPATIEGNAGNDTIQGGNAADTIRGGAGDDVVRSATTGPDIVDLGEQTGASPQGVIFDGTGGNDTIRVKRIVVDGVTMILFDTSFGSFSHAIARCNTVIVNGLGGADEIVMDPSAGNNWRALFDGGAGRDVLIGSRQSDTLIGGDGNDWLDGGTGLDVLLGGGGDDNLVGGADADWLDGGSGNDSLAGGAGDDWLVGGAGSDKLKGGTGRDSARRDELDTLFEIESLF